jgi:hypothetical protein
VTSLTARPLTIRVRRSGGLLGTARSDERAVEPGSAAHEAALIVLRNHRRRSSSPAPRLPDAFSYDLAIASPARTVLHRTFRDPLPDDVAALLAGLAAGGRPGPG